MKDLNQLYQEYQVASTAFRTALRSQGFFRIDIGEVGERYIWLRKPDYNRVYEMLSSNESPEDYCEARLSRGEAFLEWL
jgi:hypothetical protein